MKSEKLTKAIQAYRGNILDFQQGMKQTLIDVVEEVFNRHNEDEVDIMFPKTMVLQEWDEQGRTDILTQHIVNGIRMTRQDVSDKKRYSFDLLNEEDEPDLNFATDLNASNRIMIVYTLIQMAKDY